MRHPQDTSGATSGRTSGATSEPGAEPGRPASRPAPPALWGAVLFLLALLALAGGKSYRDLAAVRERESELESQLAATRAEIESFEHRLERLRRDPVALERLAREELGMVRPGDVVIVLPPEEPAAP
jgi:cell division protein FtsB